MTSERINGVHSLSNKAYVTVFSAHFREINIAVHYALSYVSIVLRCNYLDINTGVIKSTCFNI